MKDVSFRMNELKLVIFDMDGLLFDTEWPSYLAMKKAAEEAGFEFSMDIYKRLIGSSDSKTNEILLEIYGRSFFEKNTLQCYREKFQFIIDTDGVMIKKGAGTLLDVLDDLGIKKCIASSSSREVIQKYLSMTGLTNRFDFYLSGREVKQGKPSPDIFLEACNRAGEGTENSLVLEDSYHGFKAAISAGIKCIVVPDLIKPNEEMKSLSYNICSDLMEVANLIKS